MNNIKISKKFFILGTFAFISLLLLAILTLNINKKSLINLTQVFTDFTKVQKLQSSYIEPLFALREKNLTLVMSPNEDFKQKADKSLMLFLDELDTSFNDMPKNIKEKWLNYKNLLLTTREYALKGFDEGAFMNASSSERGQFYALVEDLKSLQKQRLEDSKSTFLQANDTNNQNNYYIVIGFLLIGIGSLTFDWLVIRKILKSIEKVQTGLSNFFAYLSNPNKQTDKEALIRLECKDEFGIMAKAINRQVEVIKKDFKNNHKLIEEATNTVNELKEGKFGNRLDCEASSKELNILKSVMNDMIDNLESKIQEEIYQRTNQEKLLVQQSKLAAMGNMLGNIAHQWRQPISEINSILMEVEATARYDDLKIDYLLKNIALCYDVTEHMSKTITDFQNFFKSSKEKENFNVHEACKSAVSIILSSLNFHNIELVFNINKDAKVYGYPREFSHAILNILSNAKDAFVERNIQNPQIIFNIKSGKQFIVIHIEDNAGGIKLKNMDRIFEPYFTTKHAKVGTGIGLYMTKVIIEHNMNGYINVQNTDLGALFTIKIKK